MNCTTIQSPYIIPPDWFVLTLSERVSNVYVWNWLGPVPSYHWELLNKLLLLFKEHEKWCKMTSEWAPNNLYLLCSQIIFEEFKKESTLWKCFQYVSISENRKEEYKCFSFLSQVLLTVLRFYKVDELWLFIPRTIDVVSCVACTVRVVATRTSTHLLIFDETCDPVSVTTTVTFSVVKYCYGNQFLLNCSFVTVTNQAVSL